MVRILPSKNTQSFYNTTHKFPQKNLFNKNIPEKVIKITRN